MLQGGHGKIDKDGDTWHDDNPWMRFKRVKCPKWHTDISGFWNNNDGNFPEFDEEKWKNQLYFQMEGAGKHTFQNPLHLQLCMRTKQKAGFGYQ